MTPFVHVMRTPCANYVYDVNKHSVVRVTDSTIKWLYNSDDTCCGELDEVLSLKNSGYFKINPIQTIEHPLTNIINGYLNNNLNNITLQITMGCNFYCAYCSFSGNGILDRTHQNTHMTWDTAKASLDFFIEHSRYSQILDISFYGGEPLLNFPIIKKSVLYLYENITNKKLFFHMTTNAYLLNEQIVSFLEEHSFDLLISFDGPDYIHNKNRKLAIDGKGTYNIVYNNLKMIAEKHQNYVDHITLNAVIDPEIAYGPIYDYFNNDPVVKKYNYQFSVMDQSKLDLTYAPNLKSKKANMFEELQNIFNISGKINVPIDNNNIDSKYKLLIENLNNKFPLPSTFHPRGQCAVGYKKLFVDVSGNLWPCEKISGLSDYLKIGNVTLGFDFEKIDEIMNFGKKNNKQCQKCWAIRFCNICLATLDNTRDISHSLCGTICRDTRKEIEEQLLNLIVAAEIRSSTLEI